jgi:dihydroorotate dehydrogenase (NAD+) catalytic subunit
VHSSLQTSLRTSLAGLSLASPVLLAAGTAGTLDELSDAFDLARIGGLVTKSITPDNRDGNKPWRVVPLEAGMLNAVGLANPGIDAFVRDYVPKVASVGCAVIGSIAGFSVEDYVRVASAMDACGCFGAVELNVSCPNVHKGCEFAADPQLLQELLREVRAVLPKTRLFVKLSPIPTGKITMTDMARAAIDVPQSPPTGPNNRPGADALCIANTTPAMAIDVVTRRPKLGRISGGLSGPAVHAMAVKLVFDVYRGVAKETATPIVGIGGVLRWEHAAEFILAGASAVQVGTGLFVDPRCPLKIQKGLEKWVKSQRASNVRELVGMVDVGESQPRR